jgi:hypothetical protein
MCETEADCDAMRRSVEDSTGRAAASSGGTREAKARTSRAWEDAPAVRVMAGSGNV